MSRGQCLGGCLEFAKHYNVQFQCRSSCHNEWFYEVSEPLEHYVEGTGDYFLVCCAACVSIEKKDKQ